MRLPGKRAYLLGALLIVAGVVQMAWVFFEVRARMDQWQESMIRLTVPGSKLITLESGVIRFFVEGAILSTDDVARLGNHLSIELTGEDGTQVQIVRRAEGRIRYSSPHGEGVIWGEAEILADGAYRLKARSILDEGSLSDPIAVTVSRRPLEEREGAALWERMDVQWAVLLISPLWMVGGLGLVVTGFLKRRRVVVNWLAEHSHDDAEIPRSTGARLRRGRTEMDAMLSVRSSEIASKDSDTPDHPS